MLNRPKKQENLSARLVIAELVVCPFVYRSVSTIVGLYTFMQKKYRQKVDRVKFTQVADTPSIKHAKKSQELQSDVRYDPSEWIHLTWTFIHEWSFHPQLAYKAGTEQIMHQYTMSKDEPLFKQAKANAELLSGVWTKPWLNLRFISNLHSN